MVTKTLKGIHDLEWRSKRRNVFFHCSSILCDACWRFVFPPCIALQGAHTQKLQYIRKVAVRTVSTYFMCLFFVSGLFVLPFFYPFIIFSIWQMCLCCWVIRVNSYLDLVGCSLFVWLSSGIPCFRYESGILEFQTTIPITIVPIPFVCWGVTSMLPAGSLWLCAGSASKRSLTLLNLVVSRPCSVSGRKEAFVGMLPDPVITPHP